MIENAENVRSPGGLRFTERMAGHMEFATDAGQITQPVEFTVTIFAPDLDRFLSTPDHPAELSGTISSPAFGGMVPIERGTFQLFVDDAGNVNTRNLRYRMAFRTTAGKELIFDGKKTVVDRKGISSIWADTTTLVAEVHQAAPAAPPPVATGVLHISPADFLRELTTIEIPGAPDEESHLHAVSRFVRFFAGELFQVYGGIFLRRDPFNPEAPPRKKRPLRCAPPEVHWVSTSDGLKLRLSRYRGGDKGPLLVVHGLGVSSLIFSIDTIETSLLEYFYAAGYDVWLFDYRASIDLPYAMLPYTADDIARIDYPAGVQEVRRITGAATIQCLVHCYGANTFFMAMLSGLEGVRSVAVSQTATHLRVPFMTHIKALFHVADFLKALGVKEMNAYVDTHADWQNRLYDHLIKFYPVHDGPRDNNPVSRRISFIYGQLYELAQLNQLTYDNLHELFGVAGIASLQQLSIMIRDGKIVQADGADIYLRQNEGYPTIGRLAIPMLIVHGAENQCWLPESTAITLELLRQHNDPSLYDRKVIPGYGHIDCIFGKGAATDIYPLFHAHLEKTAVPSVTFHA